VEATATCPLTVPGPRIVDTPVHFDQPGLRSPLAFPPPPPSGASRPATPASMHSQALPLAGRPPRSRAPSVASLVRKTRSRRPTIGAPSDFRRVEGAFDGGSRPATPSRPPFRPLELSFYRPGNELPDLPVFTLDPPVPARVRPRSASASASAAAAIRRKPIAPGSLRRGSVAESRYSGASLAASIGPAAFSPRSPSLYGKAVVSLPRSTQDFLDLLDDAVPPPVPAKHAGRPPRTLHRSASSQNMRLRTHLEERSGIQATLAEAEVEEWQAAIDAVDERVARPASVCSITTFVTMPPPPAEARSRASSTAASLRSFALSRKASASSTIFSTMKRTLDARRAAAQAPADDVPPLPLTALPRLPPRGAAPPRNHRSRSSASASPERQRSASSASSCPSLASTWSTPEPSPTHPDGTPFYRCRPTRVECEGMAWGGASARAPFEIEYGVAF
jgi:hypothetical protein